MILKICAFCQDKFGVLPYREHTAKYCSRRCQNLDTKPKREPQRINAIKGKIAHNNAQLTKICQWCNKEFKCSPSRHSQKFCSRYCKADSSIDELEYNYYKRITVNGIRMLEHRYIMEQHIGRKLTSDETIDHINRNRHDNRIENLRILSRKEHGKVSASYRLSPSPWRLAEPNKQ